MRLFFSPPPLISLSYRGNNSQVSFIKRIPALRVSLKREKKADRHQGVKTRGNKHWDGASINQLVNAVLNASPVNNTGCYFSVNMWSNFCSDKKYRENESDASRIKLV